MTDGHRFDVGIIGAGSGGEALVRELEGSGLSIVVFEDHLVGGECPFLACMPGKSMLHGAAVGDRWDEAVSRRDEVTHHLDDSAHASQLAGLGAEVVRSTARLDGPGRILAGDASYEVDHVVIAAGADARRPELDGDAEIWTSADALTSTERPGRVAILGAGPIGLELAHLYRGFGTQVVIVDVVESILPDLHQRVGELVADRLERIGVEVLLGRQASSASTTGDGAIALVLDDGRELEVDRLIAAIGKRPRLEGLGLETIGVTLADGEPLPVDEAGMVLTAGGSVWAVGDVVGKGEYTHWANHQARVVADNLRGHRARFGDVVRPACIFTDPPVMTVGPTKAELDADAEDRMIGTGDVDHLIWVDVDVADVPRATTDELEPGVLVVAADRRLGSVVAAHGVGARFDELVHALAIAIDGNIPVARLARSVQAFPTVGEVLGVAFRRLDEAMSAQS